MRKSLACSLHSSDTSARRSANGQVDGKRKRRVCPAACNLIVTVGTFGARLQGDSSAAGAADDEAVDGTLSASAERAAAGSSAAGVVGRGAADSMTS